MKKNRILPIYSSSSPKRTNKSRTLLPPIQKPRPQVQPQNTSILPAIPVQVSQVATETSAADPSPVRYKYQKVWKRAAFKIKVQAALRRINDDLLVYGTAHELTNMNEQYKANIDELIDRKAKKEETFRTDSWDMGKVKRGRCLIHPDHWFKKCWNAMLVAFMLYTAIIMPYRLAFSDQIFWDPWTGLDLVVDCVFLSDIFLSLFSITVNDDGSLEMDRKRIICGYMKKWLVIDIISSFPITLVDYYTHSGTDAAATTNGKYNNLVRLTRLPRMYKLLRIVRILKVLKHYSNSPIFERLQDCLQINSSKA